MQAAPCCGDSAVVIWHPPCSGMCLWSSGRRELALLGAHKEETLKIHQQHKLFSEDFPMETMRNCPRISPTE